MWQGQARTRALIGGTAIAALSSSCGPTIAAPPSPANATLTVIPEAPPPPPAPTVKVARPRPDTTNMVRLPAGTYQRMETDPDDSEKQKPGRMVTVAPFWMDVTPVTALDYAKCVVDGGCTDEGLDCTDPMGFREDSVPTYGSFSRADHPINCVNQLQAAGYCDRLGKRLPTAEEWEWAARGADRGTRLPWGDQEANLWDDKTYLCWGHDYFGDEEVPIQICDHLFYGCIIVTNYRHKPPDGTCPVRAHPMGDSPQGIADLVGNVLEWTSTVLPGERDGREIPLAVQKGLCWRTYNPEAFRVLHKRDTESVLRQLDTVGFRCAWTEGSGTE